MTSPAARSSATTQPRVGIGLRRCIGAYESYAAAQRAVDLLSDNTFPVEHVMIVGNDLRLVEKVIGRLTVGRAAVAGALAGAWFGFLVGIVFWIVSPWSWTAVLSAVLLGLAFGAVFGAVTHAMSGGRRDFASVQGIVASRYEVLVDDEYAAQALTILGHS
jgi:hypothetical protein